MSTEKRDALVFALEAGLPVHGTGTPEQRHHGVLNTVNDVIAEALRNAAEQFRTQADSGETHHLERAGLDRAARNLFADADALENGPAAGETRDEWKHRAYFEHYGVKANGLDPLSPMTPEQAHAALEKLTPLLDRLTAAAARENENNETERTEDR